jgi:hypothetical protein
VTIPNLSEPLNRIAHQIDRTSFRNGILSGDLLQPFRSDALDFKHDPARRPRHVQRRLPRQKLRSAWRAIRRIYERSALRGVSIIKLLTISPLLPNPNLIALLPNRAGTAHSAIGLRRHEPSRNRLAPGEDRPNQWRREK